MSLVRRSGYGTAASDLKVTMFTNEYPPYIYGGAGVHVDYLSRALSKIMKVEVRSFGDQKVEGERLSVKGYKGWDAIKRAADPKLAKALEPFSADLLMAGDAVDSDVVHCHTWYTFMAGFLAKMLYGLPLVTTIHSLEPLRPWKREQLGTGYDLSTWMERTGIENSDKVIAVSKGMKEDIISVYGIPGDRIEVIYNGIDLEEYKPSASDEARRKYGVKDKYILFVGRVTRQKGITHLVDAAQYLPGDVQVVLCAGAPDTKEIQEEMEAKVKHRPNILWINEMVSRKDVIELYSNAMVFVCPSIYEPFGIINLEAMACHTPVVASAVGGILEVVVDGETGLLVEPGKPKELAAAITRLLGDPALRRRMGDAGRKRVEEKFSWDTIAAQTKELYARVKAQAARSG